MQPVSNRKLKRAAKKLERTLQQVATHIGCDPSKVKIELSKNLDLTDEERRLLFDAQRYVTLNHLKGNSRQ